eukprot:XP_008187059.1 PREDICTED: uncharacterized protein LOC100575834 isoform X2 [Acyrthosiphon pisum]
MPIETDTPDDDDDVDMQGLLLAILASSSWPSTTGGNEDDDGNKNVGWKNVPGGSHVRTLDETNFRETIGENCCVLVFFHADSALQGDHCIVAAAVDCTDDTELAIRCNVDGLPTMLFFWNGEQTKTVRYQGDWLEADMRLFAVNMSANAHRKPKKVRRTGDVEGKKHRGKVRKRKKLKIETKKQKNKKKTGTMKQ